MTRSMNDYLEHGQDMANDVVGQAQAAGRRGRKVVGNAARQARESVSDAADSVFDYTKNNPAKALLIAAASGAVLLTLVGRLLPPRD